VKRSGSTDSPRFWKRKRKKYFETDLLSSAGNEVANTKGRNKRRRGGRPPFSSEKSSLVRGPEKVSRGGVCGHSCKTGGGGVGGTNVYMYLH